MRPDNAFNTKLIGLIRDEKKEAVLLWNRIQILGKAYYADVRRLNEIIPVASDAARGLGLTLGEFRTRTQAGKVSAEEFFSALAEVWSRRG